MVFKQKPLRFVCFLALSIACLFSSCVYAFEKRACTHISIRALDKVTATVSELYLKTGEVVSFGTLSISLHECWVNAPEDPLETVAFLDIKEKKFNSTIVSVFKGWMFASQPALSALEHPVYDVWIHKGFGVENQGKSEHGKDPEIHNNTADEEIVDPEVDDGTSDDVASGSGISNLISKTT